MHMGLKKKCQVIFLACYIVGWEIVRKCVGTWQHASAIYQFCVGTPYIVHTTTYVVVGRLNPQQAREDHHIVPHGRFALVFAPHPSPVQFYFCPFNHIMGRKRLTLALSPQVLLWR